MKSKERRETGRTRIKVLVKCLPNSTPSTHNGHESLSWNMWAENIAEDGVGLHWSKKWAQANCQHCRKEKGLVSRHANRCVCTSPSKLFKLGQKVSVEGLIYTEKGDYPLEGTIRWLRPNTAGDSYAIGVSITTPDHRSYFRALRG